MPEILQTINWLDIIFIILLLGMVYKGMRTGVGGQILSLLGYLILLFVSIGYYKFASEAIFGFLLQDWAKPISFLGISVLIFVVTKFVERIFNIAKGEELAGIEKVGGILVAAFRAVILCGAIGIFFLLTPISYLQSSASVDSSTCMYFVKTDVNIYSWIANITGIDKEASSDVVLGQIFSSTEKDS